MAGLTANSHVSIMPLTNGKFQLTFIADDGYVTWLDEDFESDAEIQIFCDVRCLINVPHLDLVREAQHVRAKAGDPRYRWLTST